MDNAKEVALKEFFDKLEGLEWFALSGFAVHIYSGEKRDFGDIDLAVSRKDIDKFAESLGTKAQNRRLDKGTFIVEDYGFEVEFKGLNVEATAGYPKKRVEEGTFDKIFLKRKRLVYRGKEVYLCPIEELIVQKAWTHRDKDVRDLNLLKGQKIDEKLVRELVGDWGKEEVLNLLSKMGFI